jgi:hypothetical protein
MFSCPVSSPSIGAHLIPCRGFRMISHKNSKKRSFIKRKITKSYTTFCENKPNVKLVRTNLSSFLTSKYEKMDTW